MVQKTNLNAAPYYDDYDDSKNFHRILFRPGFAIQGRELTQLQSALQSQIEKHGSHIFKEGAVVIPGNGRLQSYPSLKLASTFASEIIDPSQYYNATTPVIITGATTGVTAKVVGYDVATTTDQSVLYLSYERSGSDYETEVFADGENITADVAVQHSTLSYAADVASVTTYTSAFSVSAGSSAAELASVTGPASRTGIAYHVNSGVYYVRGFFVTNSEQTLVLDKYTTDYTGTVGFDISEDITTPEDDTTLLDNATGSANFAAKGGHRLTMTLTLAKTSSDVGADFITLVSVTGGVGQREGRSTNYNHLAEEMAKRTHDESGNYTVKPFQFEVAESVTNNNRLGRYTAGATTNDSNTASTSLLSLKVSLGKAYINGFELTKTSPTIKDINKSREFDTVNAGISIFDMGNYSYITNIYGSPDITPITGEATAYKTVQFYDTFNSTRGSANGTLIGIGRARAIEYHSGVAGATSGNTESIYKLYVFDIRPFTTLTLSATPSPTLIATHTNGGVHLKGNTSGATGYVYASDTSGTKVNLTNVVGTFTAGEKLIASDSAETSGLIEDSGNTDITIATGGIKTYQFYDFRQVYMDDDDAGQDFTADFVTWSSLGLETVLLEESTVRQDGVIVAEDGEIISLETPKGAKLQDAEKNRALFKLPKRVIKTLLTTSNSGASDTQYTVRRQFIGTTNASGIVTFGAGSNETFASHAEKDYTMSILTAGGGTGSAGDIVSVADTLSGAGSATLTITDNTVLGNAAKVKLTATLLKTSVSSKLKTTKLMKQLKVLATDADGAYGTRSSDIDISLGRADAFNVAAVFDSEEASTDAAAPTLTLTSVVGTFTRGEIITGDSSAATGRTIDIVSPMSYVLTSVSDFTASETITGESSGATATISSLATGSVDVKSNFYFDTGQRDNYYDISRIVRKPQQAAPTGRLLIVYDYLEHSSGDMMTVDSYSDIAYQMERQDIPEYNATKVDPDSLAPQGLFPLADTYDFRPRIEDITGSSATLETVDQITSNSFDFYSRQYDGTGSSTADVCKPGSNIQSDIEFYLNKRAAVYMSDRGIITITEGPSAETPVPPDAKTDGMKLCDLEIPAYTFKPEDVIVKRQRHQRYTMKDIGKIDRRLNTIEEITTLNLLEKNAATFEVTDANGLNRFKSGFVVDNFNGHRVGDVAHVDYKCSMDFMYGELRAIHKTKSADLEEVATTDAQRTSAGYQKTGDLLTLPYTEVVLTEQPYGTTIERVAPFLTSSWQGVVDLDPSQDNWFEVDLLPDLIINVEGNYDAVLQANANQLGTVWNSWQTTWSGTVMRDDGT